MTHRRSMVALLFLLSVGFLTGCDGCGSSKSPTQPLPGAGSALLVANQNGAGNMTVVDLDNQTVRLGAAGLGNTPNDIIKVGNKFYVINSTSGDMNVLSINDENLLTSIDTVDIGHSRNLSPQYGALAENGSIYISNFNDGTVTILDTTTFGKSYIEVGVGPQDVVAVGDKIYVAVSGYDIGTFRFTQAGSVKIISTVNNRVVSTIAVGSNPQSMTLDDNRNLHVVCSGIQDSTIAEIYKISVRADTILQVINIQGTPGDIALTSQGIAYVAAGGWAGDGLVYRYNTITGQILNGPGHEIHVSTGAMRIIPASDGSVYVACYGGNRVDHIVGGAKTQSYPVGDGPGAMVLVER